MLAAQSHEAVFYSQFGEDRMLSRVFGGRSDGVCVEVGANNGRDGSTTLYFEQIGWTTVLIEPNPELCKILRASRHGMVFECGASSHNGVATLQMAEGHGLAHAVSTLEQGDEAEKTLRRHGVGTRPIEVPVRRLDNILEQAKISTIDFISIDVEGHELSVLKGFTLGRWRPRIIIIEDNSNARDWGVAHYLRAAEYVRFRRTGVNDWFCKKDDKAFVGRGRRVRYAASLTAASLRMAIAPWKGVIARVPGILPVVRWTRSLVR